ncbi:MAG: sulfate adenylyltransferase subunit 1 [Lachnospiraceae bacterium]
MKGLLKFITCGSVDDGKSTLIGHILYDSKLLYADQEKALELDSKAGSREGKIDYSLLLDGLMAEREQGITIDVAYRYFTTEARSFIVADTPGHEEYTRNMAVGASFADLAIILVDASQGVLVQTRRHARICALMGIREFVFAVNKMDLIDFDEAKFAKIEEEIIKLKEELSLPHVKIIPLSATEGDNVTRTSDKMPWYTGGPLITYLEAVDVQNASQEAGFYLPVQRVCRPNHTFRGFQGQIEAGSVQVGDEIISLPSNETAHIKSIHNTDKEVTQAAAGAAVTIALDKEVDVSRGCVLTKAAGLSSSDSFETTILWMDDDTLVPGKEFFVKIGTRMLPGHVATIRYKIDVNSGEHIEAKSITKNEIALCRIKLTQPAVIDVFKKHKTLGELILIDRVTNMTSACGVVEALLDAETLAEEDVTFSWQGLQARGDIFEEFYYNLENTGVSKFKKSGRRYTVGDTIPVKGESYAYPQDLDILFLRDKIAIQVRDAVITAMVPLAEYTYTGVPLVNGRGFAIHVQDHATWESFIQEYAKEGSQLSADFFNQWLVFEKYRRVVFHDNYWVI